MAFSITFNSDGGSAVPALTYNDSSVTFYQILHDSPRPTKDGYIFGGWDYIYQGNEQFPYLYDTFATSTEFTAYWVPDNLGTDSNEHTYIRTIGVNEENGKTTSFNWSVGSNHPCSTPMMQYMLWGRTINFIRFKYQ